MAKKSVADGSYVEYLRRKPGGKGPEPRLCGGVRRLKSLHALISELQTVLSGILEGRWVSDTVPRHAWYVAVPMGVLARWRDGLQSLHVWAVVPCAHAMASSSNLRTVFVSN